jgi:hypothetical protein
VKCISDSNADYGDFISDSTSKMLDLDRDEVQWTFKDSANTTQTNDIFIWKVSSSAIYFRIVAKKTTGTNQNIYLKWSRTANSDLMRSLQEDECAKVVGTTASSNSGSVTMHVDDTTFHVEDPKTQYKNYRTFSYSSSWPSIFGLLSYSIKKQLYDNDGNATTNTTQTFTIASGSVVSQDQANYANDLSYPNRIYCLVNSAERASGKTYRKYSSVFKDILDPAGDTANFTCSTSDTATVTMGVANQETFDPDTELIAPF